MTIVLIGCAVVLAFVFGLLLWLSHRTYKPGGPGHDVAGTARQTKLQGKEQSATWTAGM